MGIEPTTFRTAAIEDDNDGSSTETAMATYIILYHGYKIIEIVQVLSNIVHLNQLDDVF